LSNYEIIYSYKYLQILLPEITMSYSQKFACAMGVGIAIFFNNATSATAENVSLSNLSQIDQIDDTQLKLNFLTASLPTSNQLIFFPVNQFLTASNWSFLPSPNKIAQLTPVSPNNTTDNLDNSKSGIPARLELEVSNPNANSWMLPTKPNQVTIDVQQPITLQDAVSLALTTNQEVEISRLNVNRSLSELREAKAALYPTLRSSLGANNQQRAGAGTGAEANTGTATTGAGASTLGTPSIENADNSSITNSFDGSLSLSYDIYDGGNRGASIRSAKKQVRLEQLALERTMEETSLQVATDYYALQSAEAQVDIEEAAVRDATQTLRDAELLEQAEAGTKFEVLQARVELAQAKQTLKIEQANQAIAQRQLSDTLNIGQKVELQTKGEITAVGSWKLSLPKSIVAAYKNRAELKQFVLEREINLEQRQIALAENRPTVSLVASYDLQEQLDDGSNVADGYSVGATVDWAIFDGGAARARAEQATTDTEIDRAEFADQRNAIRLEVEDAFYNLNANQDNIKTANEALGMSEESLRLARLRFQAGAGTQTDVIDAQTELNNARGDLLNAIVDYNQSYAELQRAVSNLSNRSLADLPLGTE
jgi:outer membrane protein TolC